MQIDLFNIPLYYIAFKENKDIEKHYRDFGFKNVNHFLAIDGRKMNLEQLLFNNIITVRSYDDLKSGRAEHSGIPSLGAIGCALSHYKLIKKCADDNDMEYITIAEEDNKMLLPKNKTNITIINNFLSNNIDKKVIYNSVKPIKQEHRIHFIGMNFYIISKEACKEMLQNFFPIDVQVDWFMANKITTGKIKLLAFKISEQKGHNSEIQEKECYKCDIPKTKPPIYKNGWFNISIILIIIIIILLINKYK